MKDSHIGTYGVLALLLVTLIRWSAVTALLSTESWWAGLIAAGALSRAPMARPDGRPAECPRRGIVAGGGAPLAADGNQCGGYGARPGRSGSGTDALPLVLPRHRDDGGAGAVARRKIGGQTGDNLGASQQLAEAATLAVIAM